MAHERETLDAVVTARNDAAAVLKALGDGNIGGAEMAKLASAENALQLYAARRLDYVIL
mgnify:CR=1 FL=1